MQTLKEEKEILKAELGEEGRQRASTKLCLTTEVTYTQKLTAENLSLQSSVEVHICAYNLSCTIRSLIEHSEG